MSRRPLPFGLVAVLGLVAGCGTASPFRVDRQAGAEIVRPGGVSAADLMGAAVHREGARRDAQAETLAALVEEVRRLRAELQEERLARRAPPEPVQAAERVGRTPEILVIPPSYGVPALYAPAEETVPRGAASAPSPIGPLSIPAEAHQVAPETAEERLAAPLPPVGVLTPIPALAGTRSGQ